MKKPKETELKIKDIIKLTTKENYFEFLEKSKDEEFTCIDFAHETIMNNIFKLHEYHLREIMIFQKIKKNLDIGDFLDNVEPFDLLDAKAWDFTTYILSKVVLTERENEITC